MPISSAAPILPPIDRADLHQQAHDLFSSGAIWLRHHWLQVLIAAAIGTGI